MSMSLREAIRGFRQDIATVCWEHLTSADLNHSIPGPYPSYTKYIQVYALAYVMHVVV
jgi:hypothetical protein